MRPQFEAALRLFARVSAGMKRRGASEPVLVGGAVVEIYSNSAIATGDFDIATAWQEEFEEELRAHGFVKPSGAGQWTRGWVHPDLALGVEVVASDLLDGNADRFRLRRIDMGEDGTVAFLSVEDVIADRMGQHASGSARRAARRECWNRRAACSRFTRTRTSRIWRSASGRKAPATMASQTSPSNQATPLAEFVADIERRRLAAGNPPIPRNPGTRRTASKRALLKVIEEAGGEW